MILFLVVVGLIVGAYWLGRDDERVAQDERKQFERLDRCIERLKRR